MGKKKNKNKVSGAVKTAAKTEKKLANKLKKELANLGEEDIAKVIAEIEREEAKRGQASEKTLPSPPSPRAYASLTPHPTTNELILFGGEYHNGQTTQVYNELLLFNPDKNSWRQIKAPGAPPPRSAHQAVATPANKGELWVFGGEFTSPTETQFHHYKDLWCFSFAEKKWEKVVAPNGPSSRSGHRMALIGRALIVFGGYNDDGRECRYFDDLYAFCLDTRVWSRVSVAGRGPCARSACLMLPGADSPIMRRLPLRRRECRYFDDLYAFCLDTRVWSRVNVAGRGPCARSACLMLPGADSLIIYGGFSRVKEGRTERTHTHTELFRLAPKSGGGGYTWRSLTGGPLAPPARAGQAAAVNAHSGRAYVFGGVSDVEETEEELRGEMSDELLMLDLESGKWHNVTLRTEKQAAPASSSQEQGTETVEETKEIVTVVTDEVFTMKLGGAPAPTNAADDVTVAVKTKTGPSARMSAMMAVQRSTLYLYGGVLEKDDKQFYLGDMYSLDLHKLNEWKTIIEQPSLPDWLGSDSEEYETDSEEESEESDESDDD